MKNELHSFKKKPRPTGVKIYLLCNVTIRQNKHDIALMPETATKIT